MALGPGTKPAGLDDLARGPQDRHHRLSGGTGSERFRLTRPGRIDPIDEATVLALELESGALATLTTSFFTPVVNNTTVFGTDAAAWSTEGGAKLRMQGRDDRAPVEVELDPIDPLVDQMAAFAAAVRGEARVEVDGEAGLAVIAVMEAAVESATSGRSVDVASVMDRTYGFCPWLVL